MDKTSTPYSDANADQAVLVDRAMYGYFLCTGFLLAEVWFPRAVVDRCGQRMGIADAALSTAAVQRLLANGWLRAAPNDRWLKLVAPDELRASWQRQSETNLENARQIVQDVLVGLASELRQPAEHETLALVLRQLVHLARRAAAAQDAGVVAILAELGAGFERLGMHDEARTAYNDAAAALLKQNQLHDEFQ